MSRRSDLLASPVERLAEALLDGRVSFAVEERTGAGTMHRIRVVVDPPPPPRPRFPLDQRDAAEGSR